MLEENSFFESPYIQMHFPFVNKENTEKKEKMSDEEKEIFLKISKNMLMRRMELDISQPALSKMCGFSDLYYGRMERLEIKPNISNLIKIAKAMNITIAEFFL